MATVTGTASLSVNFSTSLEGILVSTDQRARFTQTDIRRPWTSRCWIYTGTGGSSRDYNVFPYLIDSPPGVPSVNKTTPDMRTLDFVDISEIDFEATVSKITVEVDFYVNSFATASFEADKILSGYQSPSKGGRLGIALRSDHTSDTGYPATSSNLFGESTAAEDESTSIVELETLGFQTKTFEFTTDFQPKDLVGDVSAEAKQVSVGIELDWQHHGTDSGDPLPQHFTVKDLRVKFEYTGRTNLTTGFIQWPNSAFEGINVTGSSDFEGKTGLRTMGQTLAPHLIQSDTDIRGLYHNSNGEPDASFDDITGSDPESGEPAVKTTYTVFGIGTDYNTRWDNPWVLGGQSIQDTDFTTYSLAAVSSGTDKVFQMSYRPPMIGSANLSSSFSTTTLGNLTHGVDGSEFGMSMAFDSGSTLAGFKLQGISNPSASFTLTNTGLAGITIDMPLSSVGVKTASFSTTVAANNRVRTLGVDASTGLDFSVSLPANDVGVTHTTPAPLSSSFDVPLDEKLLGVFFRFDNTTFQTLALNFDLIARPENFTVADPGRLFILQPYTKIVEVDEQTRTVTVTAQTRTVPANSQNRTVNVAEQTRVFEPTDREAY